MNENAERWLAHRTSRSGNWPRQHVASLKGKTRVSVVLPALNEESTVGTIVATIRRDLIDIPEPIVDEIVVIDSGSTDATTKRALSAGAMVWSCADVLADLPTVPGKGEALWRSLAATTGDIIVFIDADLLAFESSFITGLLGPMLADDANESVQLVKATYDRPLAEGERVHPGGGGRVTELVARPLLNLHWPDLAGFEQPLAGEYAGRRALLEQLPFATGYGVEIGLLLDAYEQIGLNAMAQVDLGERRHRHHDDQKLGRMAAEIWQTALARLDWAPNCVDVSPTLTQFQRSVGGVVPVSYDVTALERPPMISMSDYAKAINR